MLSKTRVSRQPDVGRLGAALSRPGIDPRVWVSYAVVTAVAVDPAEGVFADVTLLPSELTATARVASIYSGPNFGLYLPVQVDDEVVVVAPSGDPAEGLVILPRVWSRSDPPPNAAVDNQADVVLVVRDGRNLRINVSGGGTVKFNGDSDAMAMAKKVKADLDKLQQTLDAFQTVYASHDHPAKPPSGPGDFSGPPAQPPPDPVGPLPDVASSIVQVGE